MCSLKSIETADLANAIERLKSFHDGDREFPAVLRFGVEAISALRTLLFQREPSGLYAARCRAAEALTALKAFDTLGEFLRLDREIEDPVERLGEDVVISRTAQLIAQLREEWVFCLLLELAKRRSLRGVLAGLGEFKRPEAIPSLVLGLKEDELRPTAEHLLRSLGRAARPTLIRAAIQPAQPTPPESETSLRARRSAIGVLFDIGITQQDWPRLRPLMQDEDIQTALHACKASVRAGTAAERASATRRLAVLRRRSDWLQRAQVDEIAKSLAETRGPMNE